MIIKGYVDAGEEGRQIHYRRANPTNDAPAVASIVLLHQRPSSSRMWQPILPLLASAGFEAAALDLPGHGSSFHPEENEEFTLSTMARYVFHAICHLGLAKQAVFLVGHHLGAGVAMQVAVDFPDKVEKLALWGVPIISETMKTSLPKPPNFEDEDLKDIIHFWQIRNKFTGKPGYEMPTSVRVERLIEQLESSSKASELILSLNVEPLLKKIMQPTLCMYGDKEMLKDPTVRAANEIHNGKICYIPNGGIDVQDEYPEEFTKALIDFVIS